MCGQGKLTEDIKFIISRSFARGIGSGRRVSSFVKMPQLLVSNPRQLTEQTERGTSFEAKKVFLIKGDVEGASISTPSFSQKLLKQ